MRFFIIIGKPNNVRLKLQLKLFFNILIYLDGKETISIDNFANN